MAVVPAASNYFASANQDADGNNIFRKRKCLCGLCDIEIGTVAVCIIEVILLAHSLIFVCSTVSQGKTKFKEWNPDFSQVVHYEYLIFILIVQMLWLLTNFTTILAVKAVKPTLILLNFTVRIVAVVMGVSLSALFVFNILKTQNFTWIVVLSLSLFSSISLFTIYICFVLWSCYKQLKETKILIQIKRMWTTEIATISFEKKEKRTDGNAKSGDNSIDVTFSDSLQNMDISSKA